MQSKVKVLFICLGNICRSPMAEFVLKDMVKKRGLEKYFEIASAATSTDELGNPVHHGTRNKLREYGIDCSGKYAVQLKKQDYDKYDYLIGMDSNNIRNMERMLGKSGGKIYLMLEFAGQSRSISDPWYTGDFDATYADIKAGCEGFLKYLEDNGKIYR